MSSQQSSFLQQNPNSEPQQKIDQTCHLCDKYFKKTSHHNRHMRERHSQSRDHICSEQGCGKTFKRGSHLKRHMISHTNTKTFKCSYCIMRFGYKHHLDRHVKMVHLSEKIECVPCELKFKKKKSYAKHLQSVHPHQLGTLPKAQLSGKGENCVKGKDNGATRTGLEEIIKAQEIFIDHESESSEQGQQLYRCHYQNCMSAFLRLHDFKRHLSKLHNTEEDL